MKIRIKSNLDVYFSDNSSSVNVLVNTVISIPNNKSPIE